MFVKVWFESDGRRSSGYNSTTANGMTIAYRLGAEFLTNMNIYHDSYHNSCQHRQSEELTQHAVVRPCGSSRQMTMTIVIHAVAAFCVTCLWSFVDVQRR